MKNAALPTTCRCALTFKKTLLGMVGFVLLVPFAAHSQDAHEHGLADLRVALEGGTLLIEFESPMDNLVGFEHAPSTDAQRQALAAAEARLRDSTTLFVLPAAASCVQTDLQLESPYPQQDDDHDHGHDDHGHDDHGHDDHGHDDHAHKHDDHGHKHDDHGHADMYVVYQFECANPAALDGLEVKLIEAFSRTHTIRAQVATEAGQASVRLSKHETRLSF